MSVGAVHGCYYTNWAIYRPEPYKFTPEKIPVGLCTHIFYAFAAVNAATYEARMTDEWSDVGLKGFERINDIKKKQPGLKVLLSFGGWTESESGIYGRVASDASRRSTFIRSAWNLANKWGFDGIDLDWEYPGQADRANFVAFIKELKEGGGGKLVTAAVSAGRSKIDAGYDVAGFERYLDFLNVMSYDFHGAWDGKVGHHAAYSETVDAVRYWAQLGMPKKKILMGIGAYGRGWETDNCSPGQPASPSPPQSVSQASGYAGYFEIDRMKGRDITTVEGSYKDVVQNGRHLCYGYDDRNDVLRKMKIVKSEGFGGAFTWSLDYDDASFTIHKAIIEGLGGTPSPGPEPSPQPVSQYSPSSTAAPPTPGPVESCSDGKYRANSDPRRYEQCVFSRWMVRDCPPGTVWDPTTNNFKFA